MGFRALGQAGRVALGALLAVRMFFACGGETSNSAPTHSADPPDAGTFSCADASCAATQICLYPAYGCLATSPDDAGLCPPGTTFYPDRGYCLDNPPTPSCAELPVNVAAECSSDGGRECTLMGGVLAADCSRVCREICF